MKKTIVLLVTGTFLFISCKNSVSEDAITTTTAKDTNGFSYESVTNDPTGLRLYTLDNGLKVYLSKNTDEPKIQTYIPVRAGSVYDPKDNTGLAHYLEHMVFKGTDEIGTQNWEEEKMKLAMISDLYEKHKAEKNPDAKNAIYKVIDSLSLEASKISIANEYDKMVSSLGAQGTNAWTSNEETVYTNKIPVNELDKWLHLESERFSQLVLRLFHTELEAVYEEFNRGQDSDRRKLYAAMNDALFPTHPYGQQTTIGISEHLKNPSMEAINKYFNTYYVPNNMALVLVGDIEFEETIKKINDTFGKFEYKEVVHPKRPIEEPMVASVKREVFGPESESMQLAFRTEGVGSKESMYVDLTDMILANRTAGLIDLNLNQKQMVQNAGSYTNFNNDYGSHTLYASPKSGQTLEEVEKLLIDQVDLIKKGDFDDWMIDAVTNDLKLNEMRQFENASSLAYAYVKAFVNFQDWEGRVKRIDEMKKITKQELVDFSNKFYSDNYAVVYKRQGKDDNQVKVENPGITPIELNRGKKSAFLTNFDAMKATEIEPKFTDYASAIKTSTLSNGLKYEYVANESNDLAQLYIFFDMGKDHDRKLDLAIGFFEYVGTDTKSTGDIKKEFYKLGVTYGVYSQKDKSGIYLSGLRENIDKGLGLLEDLWANAKADPVAYNKYVLKLAKEREETVANKGAIMWTGLWEYGQFGDDSSLRDVYTIDELKTIDPQELVELVKNLRNYEHHFFYYGKNENEGIVAIEAAHSTPEEFLPYPEPKKFSPKEMDGNVYFVDYDMVQAEMLFIAKGDTFDAQKMAVSSLFNTYFGSGLSSIVFQEIRESKSLAYSAFSAYSGANKAENPDYVYAYVGTQANKMDQAMDAMLELMNNMPEADENFKAAKESTLKRIASERINKTNIFWSHERLKKKGMTENNKKEMYEAIQNMTIEDLRNFFNENIKGSNYDLMVIGNKNDVDIAALEKFGKVKELDVDYLFNYEKPSPIKD